MRAIRLNVGSRPVGQALTWAYPGGNKLGLFRIPTYELTVTGTGDSGKPDRKVFEVFRFGLKSDRGETPKVVGLARQQTHVIKAWLPHYSVHSARSRERGAWQVYGNFLIHDGPDDTKREAYASIGCIEICNGPRGFDTFNDFIVSLSGATGRTRAEQLVEIGRSGKMVITYQKAARPPYTRGP